MNVYIFRVLTWQFLMKQSDIKCKQTANLANDNPFTEMSKVSVVGSGKHLGTKIMPTRHTYRLHFFTV